MKSGAGTRQHDSRPAWDKHGSAGGESIDRKRRAAFAGGDVAGLQETTILSSKNSHPRPAGHVRVAAAAIGLLSILLAAGLSVLGILERVNGAIAKGLLAGKATGVPKMLPEWLVWCAAVLLAFGLSFAILNVAGTWRRCVLWLTTVVLVAGWAPVLSLAAHAPDIAAPLIATFWSGVCALVYAGNHRLPCDPMNHPTSTVTADEAR